MPPRTGAGRRRRPFGRRNRTGGSATSSQPVAVILTACQSGSPRDTDADRRTSFLWITDDPRTNWKGRALTTDRTALAPSVVRAPMVFERNALLDPAVFAYIDALPSIPTPDRTASPLRRARTLARLLADDASGSPLLANAGAALTERLNLRLDGLAAEDAADVVANVEDLLTTEVAKSRITTIGEDLGTGPVVVQVATHARDVARDAQRIIDSVREGVGKAWFAHRLAVEPGADLDAVRIRCAALLQVEDGVRLDATVRVKDRLDQFRVQLSTRSVPRATPTRVSRSEPRRPRP